MKFSLFQPLILGALLLLFSCSESGEYVDERHRPTDWGAEMKLEFALDSSAQSYVEKWKVIRYASNYPVEGLLNQLYSLAFSGDADIRLPGPLGGITEARISPETLLDELNEIDTVMVQDLETGELMETEVDISFSESSVSMLNLSFNVQTQEEGAVIIQPTSIGIGEAAYNEDHSFRGIRNRFYLMLNQSNELESDHQLLFLSDTTGSLVPFEMNTYDPTPKKSIRGLFGVEGNGFTWNPELLFGYNKSTLRVVLQDGRVVNLPL